MLVNLDQSDSEIVRIVIFSKIFGNIGEEENPKYSAIRRSFLEILVALFEKSIDFKSLF